MPHQTERSANNALADLLRGMMHGCRILSENTQTFSDYPGRHADVLITAPGRSPVVVEAEYEPASRRTLPTPPTISKYWRNSRACRGSNRRGLDKKGL